MKKKYPELTKSQALSKSWRDREGFTHGLAKTKIHNSWRAIRFTIKGKKIGCDPRWNLFNDFADDMAASYQDGFVLCRKDKGKPFGPENCFWADKSALVEHRLSTLEYNGETKSLLEWCLLYELNYKGVRTRFFRSKKNLTGHEILFGKIKLPRKALLSVDQLKEKEIRTKAIKMIAANKCKDKKRAFKIEEISPEWFLENILRKPCTYCGSPKFVGADRIDNLQGHIKSNIIPACYRCNTIRNNHFSVSEMKKIGTFIRENIDNQSLKEEA